MIYRFLIALLFLPVTAFGTISATDKGTGNNLTSSTTLNLTMTSMTAGNTGVLVIAYDNANGASSDLTATSYTDSVGNIWYVRSNAVGGSAGVNAEGAILTSRLTANTSSSNTLTITFVVATATNFPKAWTWTEVSSSISGAGVTQVATNIVATTSNTTVSQVTLSLSNNDLVIGMGALETNAALTADSDTLNGSWSTAQTVAADTGTPSTSISVISQSKIVNAFGPQTYNVTTGATTDMRAGYIYFTETDPACRTVSFNATAAENPSTATFALPIPLVASSAKSMGVLAVAADNNGTSGTAANFPTTLTDSKSNTWTKRQDAIYNISGVGTGVEVAIYTGDIQSSLVVGDTVGWTYTTAGVTGKAWAIWEFAPTSSSGAMTYVSGNVGAGATTTSPTITTSSITNADYVIGVVGQEGTNSLVQDSGTTNGTWKTAATVGNFTGATGMSIITQWKKVTATATQVYNPTCSSQDTVAAWISVNDSSSIGPTAAQKAAFFFLYP